MTIKISFAAAVLALLPALAHAQGCTYDRDITASFCAEGQVYDAATQSCQLATTS